MYGSSKGKRRIIAILIAGATISAAGCTDSEADPPAASSSAESTSASSASPTISEPTETGSSSSTGSSASSSDSGTLDADDEGRELKLNDFFEPVSWWEEERYD